MNLKRTHVSYLIILLASTFSLCGCFKEKCPSTPEMKVYYVDMFYYSGLLLYKDFDTIKFLKNGTDTVLFWGDKVELSLDESSGHQPCPVKELLQNVHQTFTDTAKNKITLSYYVLPSYEGNGNDFEITFNNELFGPNYAGRISDCSQYSENITVLGKSYCANKMYPFGSADYLYFSDLFGIAKISINKTVYEKIPN